MRAFLAAMSLATAFVSLPTAAYAQESVYDPWESFNRAMFAANETLDHSVTEPAARGYRRVTPTPIIHGVVNFLRNLRAPVTFTNDLLQGEFHRAGVTVARFGVNSTLGVLGLMDPAERMGLERHDEDFGQTLAVWGVPPGPYVYMPLLGPTTVRDGLGHMFDIVLDPVTWASFDGDTEFRLTRTAAAGIAAREGVLETIDNLRRSSVDPYTTVRSTYGFLRDSAVRNGRADVQDLPEFEEILDTPDAPDMPEAQPEPPLPETAAQTSSN